MPPYISPAIQLVFNLALLLAALILATFAYRSLLAVIRWSLIGLVLGILLVSAAGIVHHVAPLWIVELHRWGAHLLVIASWQIMLATLASACAWRSGETIVGRLAASALAMLVTLLLMLASFTGYLYPHDQLAPGVDTLTRAAGEATANRFYVLHGIVTPLAVLLTSGVSLLITTRRLAGADSTRERFRPFPGGDQEHLVEQRFHQP